MGRKINILLFSILLIFSGIPAFTQSTIYRQFELASGFQPVTINKMAQDPYGRLWLGTSKGLFSFDGSDFIHHPFHDSTSQNITAIYCDSLYAYLGFEDGKLVRHSLKSWKREFISDVNIHSMITRIIVTPSHEIWIATYGKGLFIRNERSLTNLSSKDGLPGNEIYTMVTTKDGTVWIGTDGGLTKCTMQNGKPVLLTYTVRDGLSDEIVQCLAVDDEENVWIGSQDNGICIFNTKNKTFTVPPFSKNWDRGSVSALSIQDNNRVMIGTQGKGLISISLNESNHPLVYDQSTGYENVKVSDIAKDSEGNFWVISPTRGLDQFPALFEWAYSDDKIKNSIQAVLYDSRSNLWFATLNALYKTHLDSGYNDITVPVKLWAGDKQPIITSIFEDYLHNIWIGTFDEGIFFSHEGGTSFIQFRQSNGLANDNVLSISGSGTSVWISTLGGVTRCDMTEDLNKRFHIDFENFTEENGLNSSYIYQTFTDSKGRVWFATDGNGLKVLDGKNFTTYEHIDSVDINTVYSVTEDRLGNIWFSTPSNGLYKFDGTNFTNYGLEAGLSDLAITGILSDANGDIVVLENDAIDILETSTNQVRRYLGKPTFEDISPNLNACFKDKFGNIWIATTKGILKYYSPSPDFSHEARLEIRQVMVYLEPIDFESNHRFTHGKNHLTFDFQAFWNSNPSQLRYRYKLEGHDLDWIQTKDQRAIYPELSPGTYTFKVQATIHTNFDDAPTREYTFTISPPFWDTWWFVTLCAIVGLTLAYYIIKKRDKRREREAKLKRERIEFQLENLKSQINPHFLFNSFNTLATLVEEDQGIALSYIDHLSDFYRSLLSFKDIDLVTLEKELELTDNYIFLLKQRHGDRLKVITDIRQEDKGLMIPPLTLQLLIENAVKHNVVSKDQPLTVEIFTLKGRQVCVRNNIQLKREVRSTKFGLQNIRARSELLGSKDFEVVETEDYFEVCVPLFNV